MEKISDDIWKLIEFRQKFPLIGSNEPDPEKGNGFHDRISFDLPLGVKSSFYSNKNHWLYSVYFRDLFTLTNPKYNATRQKQFLDKIRYEGASNRYDKTMTQYASPQNRYDNFIIGIFDKWSKELINNGVLIIEFVSWMDIENKQFYGFELKRLDPNFCTIGPNSVTFNGRDYYKGNLISRTRKIPRSKCIIIEWPDQLGGLKEYQEIVKKASDLYSPKNEANIFNEVNPFKTMASMTSRDVSFNKIIRNIGSWNLPENTSDFYQQCLRFRYKIATITITVSTLEGIEQLVNILNQKLMENATFSFVEHREEIKKISNLFSEWKKGKVSFEDTNSRLDFY